MANRVKASILIITYYWPPSGSVACHRWLFMSKHLADLGYKITVLVPKDADYEFIDDQLSNQVGDNITVIRKSIFEVRKIFIKRVAGNKTTSDNLFYKEKSKQTFLEKISLWIRANIFIPDARMLWYFQVRKFASELVSSQKIDLVISTGPPHTLHLIGRYIQKNTSAKWMADFRDPWTDIEYFSRLPLTGWSRKLHHNLQNKMLKTADIVTTVSPSWQQKFSVIRGKEVELVYNGYEDSIPIKDTYTPGENFIIRHLGTLNEDRNPDNLWHTIKELNESGYSIIAELYGEVSKGVTEKITSRGLNEYVKYMGKTGHEEALSKMATSSVLLLLINQNTGNQKGRIPAKIFEYFQAERPIILIGDKQGDAAKLIQSKKAGSTFDYNDKDQLKNFLIKSIDLESQNELNLDSFDASEFSRKSMAKRMDTIIQEQYNVTRSHKQKIL